MADNLTNLYNVLTSDDNKDKYFTTVPSIADFKLEMQSNENYSSAVHGAIVEDDLYTSKDFNKFKQDYLPLQVPVEVDISNMKQPLNDLLQTKQVNDQYNEGDQSWRQIHTQQGSFWHEKTKEGDKDFDVTLDGVNYKRVENEEKQNYLTEKVNEQAKLVPNKDFFNKKAKHAINDIQAIVGDAYNVEVVKEKVPSIYGSKFRDVKRKMIRISTKDGEHHVDIQFDIGHWEKVGEMGHHIPVVTTESIYEKSYKDLTSFIETHSTDKANLAIANQQKKIKQIYSKYQDYSNSKYNAEEVEGTYLDANNPNYNPDLFKTTETTAAAGYIVPGGQPYEEELKQAKKELTGGFIKLGEEPTREEIEYRAREIIVENERVKIKEQTITDFLDDLEDGKILGISAVEYEDETDLLKSVLTQGAVNFNKEIASKVEMFNDLDVELDSEEYKAFERLSKNLSDIEHEFDVIEGEEMVTLQNGNIVPKSKIDEYEALRLKYNLKVKTAIRLQNDIVDNLDDIKDSNLQLDLLRRNYNDVEGFIVKTGLGFQDLIVNISGATENMDDFQMYIKKKREIDKKRQQFAKPIDFDNAFDSFSNFGKFATNETATQISIFTTLATGYLGWTTLLASSFGEQYANMTAKEIAESMDYSTWRKIYTSTGYAVPELAFELATTMPLLRGAGLALKGAFGAGVRNITKQGLKEGIQNGLPYFVKGSILESLGEGGTTITQNLVTGVPWHENVDHSMFSGLMFGSTMAAVPASVIFLNFAMPSPSASILA